MMFVSIPTCSQPTISFQSSLWNPNVHNYKLRASHLSYSLSASSLPFSHFDAFANQYEVVMGQSLTVGKWSPEDSHLPLLILRQIVLKCVVHESSENSSRIEPTTGSACNSLFGSTSPAFFSHTFWFPPLILWNHPSK